jgi:hypothetical protein
MPKGDSNGILPTVILCTAIIMFRLKYYATFIIMLFWQKHKINCLNIEIIVALLSPLSRKNPILIE